MFQALIVLFEINNTKKFAANS